MKRNNFISRKVYNGSEGFDGQSAEQVNAEFARDQGEVCYQRGDYMKALDWLLRAEELGDTECLRMIGNMYKDGNACEKNMEKALEYYRKGIERGDAKSAAALGAAYYYGNGVEQDYAQALGWYLRAEELHYNFSGRAYLYTRIGNMYRHDRSCAKNAEKAAEYYQKAVKAGNVVAMHRLGDLYYEGEGVEQDYNMAWEWYLRAEEFPNYTERRFLYTRFGNMYEHGLGCEKNMEKARAYYKRGAECGDAKATAALESMYHYEDGVQKDYGQAQEWQLKEAAEGERFTRLGVIYQYGLGCEKNPEKALQYYRRGAQEGDKAAKHMMSLYRRRTEYREGADYLGDILYYSREYEERQDDAQALGWYLRAEELGHTGRFSRIGHMYYFGQGTDRNIAKALEYYEKEAKHGNKVSVYELRLFREAAEHGNAESARKLGELYYMEYYMKENYRMALDWYLKAEELGDIKNLQQIGDMYKFGLGCKKNPEKADEYYRKAAAHKDDRSVENIESLSERIHRMYETGQKYEFGRECEKNMIKAVEYYRKAADYGDVKSMRYLGDLYYSGEKVKQDYGQALEWYLKFEETYSEGFGFLIIISVPAIVYGRIGEMYEHGRGCENNQQKAYEYYRKAEASMRKHHGRTNF